MSFVWLIVTVGLLQLVHQAVPQFVVGTGGSGYGGLDGVGYTGGYGAGYGGGYGTSAGNVADQAALAGQGQSIVAVGRKDAEKGVCSTFICTEWYDNELLHSKTKETNLWGQQAALQATGQYLNAASGNGAYASGGQTQGFFDSFGWGPLVGQAAFGYGQGGFGFNQGVESAATQQGVGKTGAASSAVAYKNKDAKAASKKCVSYRCGFIDADTEAGVMPAYYGNYAGTNAAAGYGNMGASNYGGVGFGGRMGAGEIGAGGAAAGMGGVGFW